MRVRKARPPQVIRACQLAKRRREELARGKRIRAKPKMNLPTCKCGHHRADHGGMGPSPGKPILSACGACPCQQWRPMQTPRELDRIADKVLSHRPKPKTNLTLIEKGEEKGDIQ